MNEVIRKGYTQICAIDFKLHHKKMEQVSGVKYLMVAKN